MRYFGSDCSAFPLDNPHKSRIFEGYSLPGVLMSAEVVSTAMKLGSRKALTHPTDSATIGGSARMGLLFDK